MQRDTITWVAILIIFVSVSYFLAMLALELAGHLAPQFAAALARLVRRRGHAGSDADHADMELTAVAGGAWRARTRVCAVDTTRTCILPGRPAAAIGRSAHSPLVPAHDRVPRSKPPCAARFARRFAEPVVPCRPAQLKGESASLA